MNLVATSTGRRATFAALYLSEGAPIGFIWWALPTMLRAQDVPVARITLITAAVAWPWALKFLWAPLIDVGRGRRWGYRAWVLAAQAVMGLTLLPLMAMDVGGAFGWAYALLLAHAVAAATQDVAIDAWAINVTPGPERGRLSGAIQAGMLTGRWLFGAGVLMATAALPWPAVIGSLVAVIWCTSVLVLLSDEPARAEREDATKLRRVVADRVTAFGRTLGAVLRRRSTWMGLVLALVGGAGYEAVGIVAGPLLTDLGYSAAQVGGFYTASVVAMLGGAWLGGVAADRAGHRRSVATFLVLMAATIAVLALAVRGAVQGDGEGHAVFALLVAVYLGIGLFTAASYALFMDLTDPELGGTQFSAFMSATNTCESWSAYTVGRLIGAWGYPVAFVVMAGVSLLALPVLPWLTPTPRGSAIRR